MSELKGIDVSALEECECLTVGETWGRGLYVGKDDDCGTYSYVMFDDIQKRFYRAKEVRPIKQATKRPMTAEEIALLPRGTAFVLNTGRELYSPSIFVAHGCWSIGGHEMDRLQGYRLPNTTEILPFEVEAK